MTNQEILTKAIEKAITGGWDFFGKKPIYFEVEGEQLDTHELMVSVKLEVNRYWSVYQSWIIFNHDFAKALWGEEIAHRETEPFEYSETEAWKYHLQQMVIADDPIAYLGDNLPQ